MPSLVVRKGKSSLQGESRWIQLPGRSVASLHSGRFVSSLVDISELFAGTPAQWWQLYFIEKAVGLFSCYFGAGKSSV